MRNKILAAMLLTCATPALAITRGQGKGCLKPGRIVTISGTTGARADTRGDELLRFDHPYCVISRKGGYEPRVLIEEIEASSTVAANTHRAYKVHVSEGHTTSVYLQEVPSPDAGLGD